jgi:quercetin dioxygenase-like cupin family protein
MPGTQIVQKGNPVLDVLGPTVEFLTPTDDGSSVFCVMKGTLPPGVFVPLHSHPDVESFFVLSGSVQVFVQSADRLGWVDVAAGEFVHVPGGVRHAFRNMSDKPVVQLITTTSQLGRFFQEIARPLTPGAPPRPPTPDELQHLARVAARYKHWLGTPAENAAIGLPVP